MRGRRLAVLLAVVALVVGACGDTGEPTEPPGSPGPSIDVTPEFTEGTGEAAVDLPLPNGETDTSQVLLANADGAFDVYRSIGRLAGASLTCTLVLIDAARGVDTGPAYALTNGHCLGIDGNETFTDQPLEGVTAVFDYFADTPERLTIPVTRVAWASMKGTDVAILELDTTAGDLGGAGYRLWPIGGPASPDEASRDVVMVGAPVGVPLVDIPEHERFLRLGTCSMDTEPVRLNERLWLWDALRTDCPEVLPGNAGSPLIDIATASLGGLVNTTTYKGEAGAPCWLGRPCEVTEDGENALPDASYATPLDGLAGCFGPEGSFTLGGACGLDAGGGATIDGAPVAVNPAADDPMGGAPRTTWATTVGGDGIASYRAKTGPIETTDCADPAGYGDPAPVATVIDEPLPTDEQRLLLCVVGGPGPTPGDGWQPFAHATFAVAYVDTTPPTADVRFSTRGNATDGWSIEPVFAPPELSAFMHKLGRAGSTDCDDPDGYRPYRRIAVDVEPGGPWRYCVIGYDDANNPTPPVGVVLR